MAAVISEDAQQLHAIFRNLVPGAAFPAFKDTGVDQESYPDLSKTNVIIFDMGDIVKRAAKNSRTPKEFFATVEQLALTSAKVGASVTYVVWVFDLCRLDMRDQLLDRIEGARLSRRPGGTSSQNPIQTLLNGSIDDRDTLLCDLALHFINNVPMRRGLTLIMSGIAHIIKRRPGHTPHAALPFENGELMNGMPLILRTSPDNDKTKNMLFSPAEVLATEPAYRIPGNNPADWSLGKRDNCSQIKQWLLIFMYRARPDAQFHIASTSAEPGSNILIVTESVRALLDISILIYSYPTMAKELQPLRHPGDIYVCATGSLGVETKPTMRPGHEAKMIGGACYFNVVTFVNYFITVYDQPYNPDDPSCDTSAFMRTFGCSALTILNMLFYCRKNEFYSRNHFVQCGNNTAGTVWDLFRAAVALSTSPAQRPPFVESTRASMAEPCVFSISYPQFHTFMVQLATECAKKVALPDTSENRARPPADPTALWGSKTDSRDISAKLREHCSRMSLWIALSLNGHCESWRRPSATTVMPGIGPLYGYEMQPGQRSSVEVCTPTSEASKENVREVFRVPLNGAPQEM